MLLELLEDLTGIVVPVIEIMALAIITLGTVQAFVTGLASIPFRAHEIDRIRTIWIRYSSWLIAGLTFQLAADIIETSTAPGWEDIGQLGAIAVIRTFLNFFLERDLEAALKREEVAPGSPEQNSG